MISLVEFHYPSSLAPDNLRNYSPNALWKHRMMVRRDDCPHLLTKENEKNRKAMEEKFGKYSAFIRSMIYGEFVANEEGDAIFEDRHIELMKRAMRGENRVVKGDIRAAGDVSGGGDKAPLMVREGSEVALIVQVDHSNEIDLGDKWHRILHTLDIQPSQFTIDGGGIGASVAHYMEMKLEYWGCNRFMANNAPLDNIAFKDRYTELHWVLRELLEFCVLKLPFNQDLLQQMRDRRYVLLDGDKIKTEPKKAHKARCEGKSPDELDTLIYLLSDFPINELRGNVAAKQVEQKLDALTPMEKAARDGERPEGLFCDVGVMPDTIEVMMRRN